MQVGDDGFSAGEIKHFYPYFPIDKALSRIRENKYVHEMHFKNGLIQHINSPIFTQTQTVEAKFDDILSFFGEERSSPVHFCGNSVNFDQKFLYELSPSLKEEFSYRVVDLTSFWLIKNVFFSYKNKSDSTHRAVDDLKYSFEILKDFYQIIRSYEIDDFAKENGITN